MATLVPQIIQWYNNATHEIAVYEPDYGGDTGGEQRGRLTQWLGANIQWQTPDGSKPNDHAKDCSILSGANTLLVRYFGSTITQECNKILALGCVNFFDGQENVISFCHSRGCVLNDPFGWMD